ncbi:fimbrial protein [Pseudomonas sp. S1_E04]
MKHSIIRLSTLLGLGLPLAAHAECDRYPMATTHTLTLAATITVPDSLPVGSVITRQPFSGTGPSLLIYCPTVTQATIIGKYPDIKDPATLAYHTEVPGIGIRIFIKDARGLTNPYGIHSQSALSAPGIWPTLTNAEAAFYKIGPVTTGVIKSGDIFRSTWHTEPNMLLRLGNAVRFVRPAATCDLAAGDVNRTITLDPVKVSTFQTATFAGARHFELSANCSDATNVTFSFSGSPAPGNTALFANTGTASGVALWLYSRINGVNQTIPANGTGHTRTLKVSGNRAVLPLGAAYHKNGTVSQGTLASTATVTLTYN